MKKETNIQASPKPGESFKLTKSNGKAATCQLIRQPGPRVRAGDVPEALAKLNQKLDNHGLTPENGELEAFAAEFPREKQLVGIALSDGPVMFRCAMKGRLVSFYVDDDLAKVSLWLVVCG